MIVSTNLPIKKGRESVRKCHKGEVVLLITTLIWEGVWLYHSLRVTSKDADNTVNYRFADTLLLWTLHYI